MLLPALLTLALIALHGIASLLAPGALWGLSHAAVLPRTVAIVILAASTALCLSAPYSSRHIARLAFPNRRGALLISALALPLFWLLRERLHFFGDGYLLIRQDGFSESVQRAPLLVHAVVFLVRCLRVLGMGSETALALLSSLAGVVAVYTVFRLCVHATEDRIARNFLAACLLTAGATKLFFGHVEYYGVFAAALLGYLLLLVRVSDRTEWTWLTWPAFLVLVSLHLSALGLLPAQLYLAWHARQSRRRLHLLLATLGAAMLIGFGLHASGTDLLDLLRTVGTGLRRYTEPFGDADGELHDFAFLSRGHAFALLNDLLLTAPFAWVLAMALVRRRAGRLPWAIVLAALGMLAVDVAFHRDLGFYRDWDIMAPYALLHLLCLALLLLQQPDFDLKIGLIFALALGVAHNLPWILVEASPKRSFAALEIALNEPSIWSPHAKGYLYEEIAIYHRSRGEHDASLAAYQNAVNANPLDSRFRVGLGNRLVESGQLAQAATQFAEAVRLRPRQAIPRVGYAQTLLALGRAQEAREQAEIALQFDPEHVVAWTILARAAAVLGDEATARHAVEEALERRPDFVPAQRLLRALEANAAPD